MLKHIWKDTERVSEAEYNGRKYYCTISAGCVFYPQDADNYLDLMKYANYSLEASRMLVKQNDHIFQAAFWRRGEKLGLMEELRECVERVCRLLQSITRSW